MDSTAGYRRMRMRPTSEANGSAAVAVERNISPSHLRTIHIWLVALAAACLFVVVGAQKANATISAGAVVTYSSYLPGAHADVEQVMVFSQQNNDDARRLVIDMPGGLIGDPNAIAVEDRCGSGAGGSGGTPLNYPDIAADGTPTGTTAENLYQGCTPKSKVGVVSAFAKITNVNIIGIDWGAVCTIADMSGGASGIYLLKNKSTPPVPATGRPEVPTFLGIHLEGTASCPSLAWLGLGSLAITMDLTAKVTVRADDQGLRIQIVDDLPRKKAAILGAMADIEMQSMSQSLNGMAPSPSTKPFMTNPTRCGEWKTAVSLRAWDSNTNANVDLFPNSVTYPGVAPNANDYNRGVTTNTAACGNIVPFAPSFKFQQTTTRAGAPVGLKATMENPVPTNNQRQPSYPRQVQMKLPVGFKINAAVAERLGAHGCTLDEFRRPLAPTSTFLVSDLPPLCTPNTEVGTVAVTVPELQDELFGKVYLGEPLTAAQKVGSSEPDADKDDVKAGIYRLYVYATRPQYPGGPPALGVRFEGQAIVDKDTGQVSITIRNIANYNDKALDPNWPILPGLPQFNYSKFVMDFNTNSLGAGADYNPVLNPNDQQQMLTNPQVCGDYPMDVIVTPWSYTGLPASGPAGAGEPIKTLHIPGKASNNGLEVTGNGQYPSNPDDPGTPGVNEANCDFQPFNPTFDVKLTEDYNPDAPPNTPKIPPNQLPSLDMAATVNGAGMHPTMTFSIYRQDRQDNLKHLKFVMPEGFGGSLKAAVDINGNPVACSVTDVNAGTCLTNAPKSKVGTVRVNTGSGALPITIKGDIFIMEKVGAEIQKYTTKLAIITPAKVGPFDLGLVVNKLYMRLSASNKFQLVSETDDEGLLESIMGVPVLYRGIVLKLDGINKQGTPSTADDRPFLFLPSKCGVSLNFQGIISSAGNHSGYDANAIYDPVTNPDPGHGSVETVTPVSGPAPPNDHTTGCANQEFKPTVQVTDFKTTPATPSDMTVKVEVPQIETGVTETTIQQSTINRVRVQFPPGVEMNPAVATYLEACPTAKIDADIANPDANTNRCESEYPKSKIGDVYVNTPLLPELPSKDYGVSGSMYLEQQGTTKETRMRFVLYLAMPGGMQIVRGGAVVAGSTDGPTAGLGSTTETPAPGSIDTSVIDGTPLQAGQLESDFNGLPDVSYRWMKLNFRGAEDPNDHHIVPMFVTPDPPTCPQVNSTRVRVNATNTGAKNTPPTSQPDWYFNTPGDPNLSFTTDQEPGPNPAHPCRPNQDFTPTADIQVTADNPPPPNASRTPDPTLANVHPDMTATILRDDMEKDLEKTTFHLPAGLVGAPAATPKCSLASAAAATCATTAPASVVGAVEVELGSAGDTIVIDNGKIYNTAPANADEPARLTTIATVALGPFDLGSMSIPIETSLRQSDMGLDSTVILPQRFEGIRTHYRRLSMILKGYADMGTPADLSDDKPFLTNPSKCQDNTFTLDAWPRGAAPNDPPAQAQSTYTTHGCPKDFPFGTQPTLDLTPTSTDSESPTGLDITMTNGTAASYNSTIKAIRITFPHGMTVNPGVGNDGNDAVCSTAKINAGGDAPPPIGPCPAASERGSVSVKTPLLEGPGPGGSFPGKLYLEEPGNTKETRFRLAMVVKLPGTKLVIRGSNLINGASDLNGPTGAVNSGTGIISAEFNLLPDLPFYEMKMSLYDTGSGHRALLVNPPTCGNAVMKGEILPNTGTPDDPRAVQTYSSYNVTNCQPTPPTPTFDASLSAPPSHPLDNPNASAGHPDFNLTVGNLGKSPQISEFDLDLPSGFVADTVATERCSKIDLAAVNCSSKSIVGSVTTTMGSAGDMLTLQGNLHNVALDPLDPVESKQPARLQVILPVLVGPYDLGKLSIPVETTMRKDYGIHTHTELPYRYEGIDVYVRAMTITVGGYSDQGNPPVNDFKPFMINPTECGTHTVTATIVRRSGPPVAPISKPITIDPATCPRSFVDVGYPDGIGLKVTPENNNTETGAPVKLAFEVTNSIDNPTLKKIAMEMPDGMELNPAVANGLTTCSSAEIDNNGGAACVNTSANVGTVVLNTPLLPLPQTGNVFLEDPIGNDKDTRYRVALVAHLPGKEMISRGTVSIDGSSTIPTGGTGNVGGGTGKMTTVFYGETPGSDLPDLAFSKMTVNFDGGFSGRPMFTNPRNCGMALFKALVTPHGGAPDILATDNYNTTSDCGAPGFDPTFSGSAVPTTSAANPELTLTATTPRKQNNIKTFDIDLPTGLVAATGNVPLCSKTQADQGNCDLTSAVGDVDAWIGTSDTLTDDYKISGKVYNVAPLPGEPARLAVGIDVQVGPFDLGKLPLPVTAELRPDWGVTTHTTLPSRYEGIAVNMRKMEIKLASSVGGKPFAINPSKCQPNTVIAKMVSDGGPPQTQTDPSKDRWSYNTTGCAPFAPATKPTIDVTPSTTQAGVPVGLRIDINSTEGNPTLKRTEVTFPEGLEINPAFAKNMTACQTADVDLSIANDPGATYCAAATKIADITMTTPLMSSKPQGRMYLEQPDPSGDADTRYRTVMILDLPGRKLVLRGQVSIDGSTDIAPGATGTADYDNNTTGQLTAVFDNIPDLGFTQLRLDFNAGSRAMTVNPTDCNQSYTFTGVFTPHSSPTTATSTSTPANWPSGCNASFAPQFTAQVDTNPASTPAAGHPDLTLQVKNGANQHELHKLTIKLPVGLVANTTATGTRCSQDDARDANCAAGESVGDFSTIIGSTDGTPGNPVADRVELTGGKIYNVVPNSDEPARMQAVMAVAVGPFDLGMLSIPVTTKLNSDMSVDAVTVLPKRYEGIAVKVRQMDMKLNGVVGVPPNQKNFMINPSRCATHTISGEMESVDGDTRTTSSTFTTTGCAPLAAAYDPTVNFTTSPHDAGAPTAMIMNVQLPADSSTTSNVKITFPQGFELSPAAANGLATCSAEQVDAGGHAPPPIGPCPAASQLATVSLTTPLLEGTQTGELYLEPSIGRWADSRFRLAMVVHLPGQNLIVRGGTLVDGASDLIDDKGAKNSGTGQVTAEFPGLPDLGFDDLSVNFDPARKLFVNPKTCGSFDVTAELTPHAGSTPVEPSPKPQITTSGGTCGQNTFNPAFTGSLTPAESGANSDLTMQITNPDGMQEIKKLDLHLPVGLVARTTDVPQCEPGNAEVGNCPNSVVGNVTTTIGSFGETLTIGGDIVNIVPEADQPARMFAVVPVLVGPFDLGKLTVDVPTKLNDDLSVTASTELPTRYEGISVRVRQLDMTILGEPYPNKKFMVAPTKCGTSAVGAHITSDTGTEVDRSFNFTIPQPTCDNRNWAAEPQMAVSASPAVRNTPSNLTFDLTSDPDNPTISKMHVELPDNVEINPAFGASVDVCDPSDIDDGGAACPEASKIAVVTMRTHLLDPNKDYVGEAYLEPQGPTAATRFKVAIVVHMPGNVHIVVRGSVSVAGATDIDPIGGTGSTAEVPAGKIIADFDGIPDLGFSSLKVAFNTTRPMLINAPVDGPQDLVVGITPHSSTTATTLSPAPSYTTTGGNTPATFNPTFTAGIDNPAPAAHPNLTLTVDRTNNNARSIAGFDLDLPVGLVASTTATNVKCTETEAADANCPAASKVGSFSTRIGNGNTVAEDLALSGGEIFNVVPRTDIGGDLTEPARLAATIQVAVGPFHLGRLAIPIETALREDAGVSTTTVMPTRYEGIAVRIKQMQIVLNGMVGGNPFMQNPSKCQDHPLRARITSAGPSPETVTKQSIITTSGCGAGFSTAPGVNVSVSPDTTSAPTALGVQITSAANNPTIGRMELALPVGMSINAAAGNGLVTCSPDPNDLPYFGCGNNQSEFDDAVQGTVSVHTPLLGDTFTGYLFLEDPLGNDKDTRYRMAIVLDLPGQAIVVHGRVQIDGSSTITPSDQTGSVDEGTGQVTTIFDAIPDLSFDDFQINMKTGPRALLTNPDTCGTQTVTTKITSNAGGPDATPSPTFDLTTGDDCGGGQGFDPTFAIADGPLPGGLHTSGANEDLVMTVTAGGTDQQLRDFTMHLPVGLVADTTATKPNTCSQADAVAAICGPGSIVGTIETKLGSGSETLDIATGEIHNVIPSHDEPARMAAIVPVDVGPYDLGRLAIPVETTLRPDPDYGVDAHTVVPLKYEGITVRIQEMKMTMLGTVGTPPNDKGFMKNPSRCDAGTDAVTADFLSASSTPVTKTADYPVGGCPVDFVSPPTLAVSGVNTQIEQPTGMTLEVGTDPDNPSIKRVKTTMPEGMTINPAVGNKVNYCPAANLVADTCPAASVIGEVEAQSPLIDGVHDGKVVLEQPGNTAATRYKLAMIIDVPGQKVIVHGTTAVDGSTDLVDGLGSTAEVGVTGRIVTDFPDLPDLNFSHIRITFDNGPEALLANSSMCEQDQKVSAEFESHAGTTETGESTGYDLSFDGNGAPCPEDIPQPRDFDPQFTGSVSTTQAAGNPDLTLSVTRQDKTQQLKQFNLHLPPGLVADSVSTPRCAQNGGPGNSASKGDCPASTAVGDVTTEIGTGTKLLKMTGSVHNVEPTDPEEEPARFAAIFDVQVGPYNLGRLSIPVTAKIVTGLTPSDLSIDTFTRVPQRYEGVPVRMRSMEIKLLGEVNGTPFMINPSKCGQHTVSAKMWPDTADPDNDPPGKTGSFDFTTTGCPAAFDPSIETTVSPTQHAGEPADFSLAINVPGNSSSIQAVTTRLPEGFEINPGIANRGGPNALAGCPTADIDAGNLAGCSDAKVGDVTLDTPLLSTQRTGAIYLEQDNPLPAPATRYKLAIVISLPGPDLVVHGDATIDGTGQGVGAGTGQISATFEDLPDLQFSRLNVDFDTGPNGMLIAPKTCGTDFESSADLAPWSVADYQTPASAKVTRTDKVAVSDGCAQTFNPSNFTAEVSDPLNPGQFISQADQASNTDLRMKLTAGATDERLAKMTIGLPVGLVASPANVATCTATEVENDTCTSEVGDIATSVGSADPLALTGKIYNVDPLADEPARLAAGFNVKVGPYDLGRLVIPVATKMRAGNDADPQRRYGIDAITEVPTRFEGVGIQMRTIEMTIDGTVGGQPFMINPSKCGPHTVTADLESENGTQRSLSGPASTITTVNCSNAFKDTDPQITAAVDPEETAMPTNFSLGLTSSAANQTIESISTTLPDGMTINPGFAATAAVCDEADADAGDFSGCAGAQVGRVALVTPLLVGPGPGGSFLGKVYLVESGNGAAERYRLAIAVELPGQTLVVRGSVWINGSTELVDGLGSTSDTGQPSDNGQMTATFDAIPDLGFTSMDVDFDTGPRALMTNPELCSLTNTVAATVMPTSGNTAATPTATFETSYDGQGQGCPAAIDESFAPTFSAVFSGPDATDADTVRASGNPDLTLTVTRPDKTQQLGSFDLELPPGLVANTVDTPRCDRTLADKAQCAETSRVGDVSTQVGTGPAPELLEISGGIYNVQTSGDDEPARLAVGIDVVVGPYDLGRLSVPVSAEIIGDSAEELRVLTHAKIPTRYEGIPIRLREMKIELQGRTAAANKPFMISPSRCDITHTIKANMYSTLASQYPGDPRTEAAPTVDFTTDNCGTSPYTPSLTASLLPDGSAGKPVGLKLGFNFTGTSSSSKKIVTKLPEGMGINPGIGNLGNTPGNPMTCDAAVLDAKPVPVGGPACSSNSVIGSVELDTPLLPTPPSRTGKVYLETPDASGDADKRYRIAVWVDLPGDGDLIVHGSAQVKGSSDITPGDPGATGAVDKGSGQVTATFDNLPDLQFSRMEVTFNTTGGGKHALLTNPETCPASGFDIRATMTPWSRPTTSVNRSATVFATGCNTPPQPLSLTASTSSLGVGEHADLDMTLTRPDGNRSIKSTKFELPKGLVGSADATEVTCADDAANAQAGVCPANSKVGEVAIDIGSSDDPYTVDTAQIGGGIYNVTAPADRPAKLVFAVRVEVGPYDLGNVVVPIDVNIDPNEYFLWAQTGDLPQVYEGIPVRISQMRMKLYGQVANSDPKYQPSGMAPFMSNPRSCDPAGLPIKAQVNFTSGAPDEVTGTVGPFTGCGSLSLAQNTIEVDNDFSSQPDNLKPEAPTKLRVKVTQGELPTQAGMRDLALSLPGFRLNAPAADNAESCSDAQLDAQSCPVASQIGTAWLDTPLLPKNVVNPDDPGDPVLHSLWGKIYLTTPGNTATDRYRMAIQMTGKTLITIRGTAVVDETKGSPTEGEMITQFEDLPDIPFTTMEATLNGIDDGGLKPLLLNPENSDTGNGRTVQSVAAMTAWSGQTAAPTSDVSVSAGSTKGFTPTFDRTISDYQSGGHPDADFTYTRPDGDLDIGSVKMSLPAGFLGSAAAVPLCALAAADAGTCSDASKVGTVSVTVGQFGQTMTLPGSVYLTAGEGSDIAGMAIKVDAKAGANDQYDLGAFTTRGRIVVRTTDHGIDANFDNVPRMFKGVPTHIVSMSVHMNGRVNNGQTPFLFNSSSCAAQEIKTTLTPYGGAAATLSKPYQATGCASRTFSPHLTFTAHGGGVGDPPAWTIAMGSNYGDSTLASTTVTLPSAITINVAGIALACTPEEAAARDCKESAKIGTVSITTPLLTYPVTGTVYMAKSISGQSLPDLMIDIPAPIDMQIRGANRFVGASYNLIQSTFTNLPDMIFSEMTMQIAGGPKGLIMLRSDGVCGPASALFGSHAGQEVNQQTPIIGIDGYCAERQKECVTPNVKVSTKGVKTKTKKRKKSKAKVSVSMTTGNNCSPMKSVRVTFPKGSKFNKKAVKKGLSGKAGSTRFKSKDFSTKDFSGRAVRSLRDFPANTHNFSLATKNGALVLPYKTFCGGLKGKKLKKCKKKKVSFIFDVTNTDGSTFRYVYKVPAGSRSFK